MSSPPKQPKAYHITHLDNLPAIVRDGELVSDAKMLARGGPAAMIGMSGIKRRRVEELEVPCHPGTKVGDYVPFFFCPRSIMLYVLYRDNNPELTYHGGQDPIVHLEADLHNVIAWTEERDRRWAFSLSNAGAYYTQFRARAADLDQLDWKAIAATDFRRADVKEAKQAEFLVYGDLPWSLVDRVGVYSEGIRRRVVAALSGAKHIPLVNVQPGWYY